MTDEISATVASENIFSDLGFEFPEEELIKAKLVRELRATLKRRRLTQAAAAALLGLRQPDVSAVVNGRTEKFSIERLVRCLARLDCKIDIVVRRKPKPAVQTAA